MNQRCESQMDFQKIRLQFSIAARCVAAKRDTILKLKSTLNTSACMCFPLSCLAMFNTALHFGQSYLVVIGLSRIDMFKAHEWNAGASKDRPQMMSTPAQPPELEPRWPFDSVLRFYNMTDLSNLSAWLCYKLKPQSAALIYTTRITYSVVPLTENHTSQKFFLPFLQQAWWLTRGCIRQQCLFLLHSRPPFPLLALQVQQKSPKGATKAQQTTVTLSYFPAHTRPPSTRGEGGKEGGFPLLPIDFTQVMQVQRLENSTISGWLGLVGKNDHGKN